MDNRPRPDTMAEWIGRENYERDRAPRGGGMGPTTVIATVVLDAGIPVLLLDDAVTKLPIVGRPANYVPTAGDTVAITRSKKGWLILERLATPGQVTVPIQPVGGWILYTDSNLNDFSGAYGDPSFGFAAAALTGAAASALSGQFYASMSATGVVKLAGVVTKTGGTVSGGEVIGTIPDSRLWPARTQMFEVVGGTNDSAQLYVCPDGTIRAWSMSSATFVGLSNITFRAKNYGTFVPLTFLNGSTNLGTLGTPWPGDTTTTHTCGYTVDAEGVILFEGLFTGGTITNSTDLARMTALANFATLHMPIAQASGFGFMRVGGSAGTAGPGNYINIGTASATWTSLANLLIAPTPVGWTWVVQKLFVATDYGSGYQSHRMGKTPSGLVMLSGLTVPGALGSSIMYTPKAWSPRYQNIFATANSNAFSRTDVNLVASNVYGNHQNNVVVQVGSSSWHSLDGVNWLAGV